MCKGGSFEKKNELNENLNTPLKIIYTGNIISGRWKTLVAVADKVKKINADGEKVQLFITTTNYVSNKVRKKIVCDKSIFLLGKLPFSEVKELQRHADILLYVEPFTLAERYIWRLSFSTKIVDYLEQARCVLAIGWEGGAGIKYLRDRDAALIVTDMYSIEGILKSLINDTNIIIEYSKKAFDCGIKNHQLQSVHSHLYIDFCNLINSK